MDERIIKMQKDLRLLKWYALGITLLFIGALFFLLRRQELNILKRYQ